MLLSLTAFGLAGEPKGDPKTEPPETPFRVGDTVMTMGPAPVKVGEKTLATLEAGAELKAVAVQDAWVKVAVDKEGQKITGWINKRHLKLVAPAATEKAPDDRPAKTPEPGQKPPARELGIWEGFRGIAWATNIKEIQGMDPLGDDRVGRTLYYRRADDKLAIGEARLTRITYGFYKDRFHYLRIQCAGLVDFLALKRAVFATYGEGARPNRFMERWLWGAPFPGVKDVMMTLDYNELAREGNLTLFYRPLAEERKRDEEEVAKKARKDF